MYDNIDEIDFIPLKVIEKNALSKSTRQAKERKEELSRVLTRVENIYGEFEKPSLFNTEFSSLNSAIFGDKSNINDDSTNVECVKDVPALEQLLVSYQSRQKYLQQVTVFIVGYSNVAKDRLRLMQEVNQFFINNEDVFDSFIEREDKIMNNLLDADISKEDAENNTILPFEDEEYSASELADNVKQAIDSCQQLVNRLGELNDDMIDCFVKYAQNKAGNKGRKKLEKALENAVNETTKLSEKLSQSFKVITEKDSRIDTLMKQCESKSKEVQKFKALAESIKKAAMESDKLREQLKLRDAQILNLQSELVQSQIKIDQTKTLDAAQRANAEENAQEFQEKCKILEKTLEDQKVDFEEIKRNSPNGSDLKRQFATELKQVQANNDNNLQQIKVEHQKEMQQLKSSEFDENAIALQWSEPEEDFNKSGRQSSSLKSKNELPSPEKIISVPNTVPHSRSGSDKLESRQNTQSGRLSSGKDVMGFSDVPELDNEEFWSNIPRTHLIGRFAQFRQMCMASMSNLLDQIESLQLTNTRQIHSLKSQHQLHKRRWDQEREMLIEAVRTTEGDKREAQNFADQSMKEIENFVSLLKLNESETNEFDLEKSENSRDIGLLERIEQIKDYLKNHNFLKDPISRMLDELFNKCQLIEERSRITVPKFVTMIDLHRSSKGKQRSKSSETQTDNVNQLSIATIQDLGILDENKDILFPDENEEIGSRSVAISASPTLVRIAFCNDTELMNEYKVEDQGVTSKDLEVPSGMIDIEDRTGLNLIQHPVITDYLHSYDQILTFKEHFISILHEIDNSEVSEIINLQNINPVSIRSHNRIIPQIEEIGRSIEKILQISLLIIERILFPKKKISLQTKSEKESKSQITYSTKGKQLKTKEKITTSNKLSILLEEFRELKRFVKELQHSYNNKFKIIISSMNTLRQMILFLNNQYFEKMSNNNETIQNKNNQKSNISTIEYQQDSLRQSQSSNDYESVSIMFTRRDSERNIERMQQAILNDEFPKFLYEEAIEKMSQYIEIPAKQLYVLVRKYLHKDSMAKIAKAVKKHKVFNMDTLKILNQMELNIEKKQRRYSEIQEYLRNERILRANALLDTCMKIENESSILIIKPILRNKSQNAIKKFITEKDLVNQTDRLKQNILEKFRFLETTQRENINIANPNKYGQTWTQENSIDISLDHPNIIYESRLLEIDTNRMLLPLNSVSVSYSKMGLIGNESFLPPQIAVRSYVAVAHPTLVDIDYSPQNSKTPSRKGTAVDASTKSRMSRDLSKHLPLPPIIPLEMNDESISQTPFQENGEKINKENEMEFVY